MTCFLAYGISLAQIDSYFFFFFPKVQSRAKMPPPTSSFPASCGCKTEAGSLDRASASARALNSFPSSYLGCVLAKETQGEMDLPTPSLQAHQRGQATAGEDLILLHMPGAQACDGV